MLHHAWRSRTAWTGALAAVVVVIVIPAVEGAQYQLTEWEAILSLTMAAVGLNIVTGFAGQLSIGPGAVFGIGAYTAAVLADHHASVASIPVLSVAALGAAAVVGFVTGIPALRVGGFYLGMVTLYLALIVPQIVSHVSFTGGQYGISLISNLEFTQHPRGLVLYELTAVVLLVLSAAAGWLLHAPTGRRFVAVRTGDVLAQAVGITPYRAKLTAFVVSSLPAGIGGAFYVYTQQLISPNGVSPSVSIDLLAAVVIGGLGSVWGPVFGGLVVFGAADLLSGFERYQLVVFGALLVAVVLRLPRGLAGATLDDLLGALAPARRPTPPRASVTATIASARPGDLPAAACEVDGPGALTVRGAVRSFGGVRAVDGVDLDVVPGTIHGLIGPNGSGKTTVLNLVSGYYALDAGTVHLGRRRIDSLRVQSRVRAGIARTFQTPQLVPSATLLDNVLVAVEQRRVDDGPRWSTRRTAARRARARACLASVGVDAFADIDAGRVPHPVQRLTELARAVALDPAVVLLDEPAAGLGAHEIEQLRAIVVALARRGTAVLLVEHNMAFVLEVADCVTVLHQGRVLAHGTPAEIASDEQVISVYLGERDAAVEP